MKYKKFETEKLAFNFSESVCKQKGCAGTTKYWYNVIQAIDGWYAVIYDDADIPDTTEVEPQWIKNTENKMG